MYCVFGFCDSNVAEFTERTLRVSVLQLVFHSKTIGVDDTPLLQGVGGGGGDETNNRGG